MPQVIIVAGPNGAGKSSFAQEFLSATRRDFEYVNADEIAYKLSASGLTGGNLDVAAARQMLQDIDAHVLQQSAFMLETTLATLTYARRILGWRRLGYSVSLIYLRLPAVEASIDRVRRRVVAGGHEIPEDVIRRRFAKSADYLERVYKPILDDWSVCESLEGEFRLAEAGSQE